MTPDVLRPSALPAAAERLLEGLGERLAWSEDPFALLSAHGVPAAAIDEVVARRAPTLHASAAWQQAVVQGREHGRRLDLATTLAERALRAMARRVALSPPSLGPLWQSDVDVFVRDGDLADARRALGEAGFLDVQPLLVAIGRVSVGVHRFGALDGEEVLASVELCTLLHDHGPSVDAALRNAEAATQGKVATLGFEDVVRRRCAKAVAARRLPLRSAVELTLFLEAGRQLPPEADVDVALHRCAALERELIGEPGPLAQAAAARRSRPNVGWVQARGRRGGRAAARRLRPRRLLVAFSGVGGAGKSTQSARLMESLIRLDVPARVTWLRIGYGESKLLQAAARLGGRFLPRGSEDALKASVAGADRKAHATRRGALVWAWALAVTLNFVLLSRRNARQMRGGVFVSDSALPDALVGLEEGYGGAVRLGLQRRLMERLTPRPDITFYMRLSPQVAYARKRDIFAAEVLEGHARAYDELLERLPRVVTLDAERPLEELSLAILRRVCSAPREAL